MTESVLQRTTHMASGNNLEMIKLMQSIQTDVANLVTSLNQLRSDFNNHVHGGVTVGAGNTSAVTTTAAVVTLNTIA